MDFRLTEEQRLITDSIRELTQEFSGLSVSEILKTLSEVDFLGVFYPEELGGAGGDFTSYILALEEIAKVSPSAALAFATHCTQASNALFEAGSPHLKESFLPQLFNGEKIGTLAHCEAWPGKDMLLITTVAEKKESDYILNGTKSFVLNGGESDIYIVSAKTDEGISLFLVESNTPGIKFSEPHKKMGLNQLPIVSMMLDNVRIPSKNLIGKEGEGDKVLSKVTDLHNISLAAIGIGIASKSMEKSLAYGKERKQFNRPILKFEALQEMIGKMSVNLSAAQLLTLRAANSKDNNEDYKEFAASAKYFSLKTGEENCIDAIQIHGGYGYSKDMGVEVLLRDIKGLSTLEMMEKPMIINIARQQIG